jgi:putative iron-dependent peroxidase
MPLDAQPGILQPVPAAGRHLWFALVQPAQARAALTAFTPLIGGDAAVVGLGLPLVQALGATMPGLREFPALTVASSDVLIPSTPAALWVWLRRADRGSFVHATRRIAQALAPALTLARVVDTFDYGGRDLTGYEDGTENPKDDAAIATALVQGAGPGYDGASFAAVQQWGHDFDAFERLAPAARDNAIGRRLQDNAELADAPA